MKHSAIKTLAASLAACAALLLLASCADGDPESGAVSSAAEASAEAGAAAAGSGFPDQTDAPLPAAEDENAAAPETEAPAKTPEELLALAMDYIGKPVDDLIAVIGEPEDRDYAPSCMGDGEDGNLYYGGFIVYTYRENGEETVQDVE